MVNQYKKKRNLIIVILIFIGIVIVYLFTNGKKDGFNNEKDTLENKRKKARKELDKLKTELAKKEGEEYRIERRIKRSQRCIRAGIVFIWLASNVLCFLLIDGTTIDKLLMYNEILIISLVATIYIIAGTITDLKELNDYLRTNLETRVYRNRLLNKKSEVEAVKQEIAIKENEIS